MHIERLGPYLGVRVTGLDLRDLTIADRPMIRDLLEEHLVLFFEGQDLSEEQFKTYGQVVGDLDNLVLLSNEKQDEPAVQIVEMKPGTVRGLYTDSWHSDACYLERPPYATTIKPVHLPPIGGDTIWASMYAAYELMAEPLRRLADELQVVQAINRFEHVHPVVRVNPRTGRRALYVNSVFSQRILGVSKVESQQLIDMFCTLATIPDVQVRYRWTPHTVAIWDNRFTQHYAVADYTAPRKMHRLTIMGEPVLGVKDWRAEAAE
ncbi:TauD/TfdA dioxygenase family protein [Sphingomonas montanisoli]|nr:TauD/TfdA family dioxygenase [Sphingomonas montanisoli]